MGKGDENYQVFPSDSIYGSSDIDLGDQCDTAKTSVSMMSSEALLKRRHVVTQKDVIG